MNATLVNTFRLGGFIGACVAAVLTFLGGDVVTASGIIAAAVSAAGGK